MTAPRILLPPGIGDIHWVLLKLRGWLDGLTAHAWIIDAEPGRRRGLEFLRRVPMVKAMGYHQVDPAVLHEKLKGGINCHPEDVVDDFLGFDHYLCFNNSLANVGKNLDEILRGVPTEWDYKITELEADRIGPKLGLATGGYALFYFSDFGMHRRWAEHFTPVDAAELLKAFRAEYPDLVPVLIGMGMDGPFNVTLGNQAMCLVGQTNTAELLSLIRGARILVGFHNGPTIISQHLGTPTLMLWSRTHFTTRSFRTNWVAPQDVGRLYFHADVEDKPDLMGQIKAILRT